MKIVIETIDTREGQVYVRVDDATYVITFTDEGSLRTIMNPGGKLSVDMRKVKEIAKNVTVLNNALKAANNLLCEINQKLGEK